MDQKSQKILGFDKILERLAAYASFSAGVELVLALEPTADLAEARRRQQETSEAVDLLDRRTDITIGGARDVRLKADNAQRGYILQPEDLLDIKATIVAGRELARKLVKLEAEYPSLAEIARLIEDCPGLVADISSTLDDYGEVLDSASDKLAEVRKNTRIVHGRIQDKLQSLVNSSANQYLQEPTITTRAGRYVVPLKANYKGRIKGIVHDQSNSGATLWIEPANTVELNNEYRSLHIAEQEEIQRILADLSGHVAHYGDSIKRIVDRLAELDSIFARARYAAATSAVKPDMVPWQKKRIVRAKNKPDSVLDDEGNATTHPGSVIWIRGARHPLLDPETVVPTDLLLDEDVFLVLITGPNTGGKTVSLKTVGLMALMAQSGLHLPAVEARITVFTSIFADIGDEQSIEQNLSTFSGHMTNIVSILGQVDDRSLVLLDELGSGTDPAEGAALAQSIVSYLRDIGATTFVATHYPELKVFASNTSGAINASLLFDIDTLQPTFEMSMGMPGRSNALAIARRLGLDETILDDALKLIGSGSTRAESLLDALYDMRDKITSQEAETRLNLKEVERERDQLSQRLQGIEQERERILQEAREQVASEMDALQREIRQVRRGLRDAESLNKLKKLQKESDEVERGKLEALELEPEIEEPAKRAAQKIGDLKVGDFVRIKSLGTEGQIYSLDKQSAEVVVGQLHMRLDLDEIEFRRRVVDATQEPATEYAASKQMSSPGMELDLRGLRVDEGLAELERYLDSAFLTNLPWVRVIHGKGTGRLREAVRTALQQNEHVVSWEEGKDGEGGAGVTVAKLAD